MKIPLHTSVLIVGAGPSGLMMATQLLRYGIQPIIIDSKTGITQHSRAIAIQARSLELLRQLGIEDDFLKEGNQAKGLVMHQGSEEKARLDISALGATQSRFPFILLLEQSQTEKFLLAELTKNTCPVYWNTRLLNINSGKTLISVMLRTNEKEYEITCNWLIGADGANSTVRRSLNIPFRGGSYKHQFYLADLTFPKIESSDAIRIYYTKDGFAAVMPLQNNKFRFIGKLPKHLNDRNDLSFDEIRPLLSSAIDFPISDEKCLWFSTYKLHHKKASEFQNNRCFLIGDAAHIHSPAGGQGMNTGLQDAHNLAWKLAGVIKKDYESTILASYAEERSKVASQILRTTDLMFNVASGENIFYKIVRSAFPRILNKIWNNKDLRDRAYAIISQTGINYRDSSLSVHHSLSKNVRAGDRLPYVTFFNERQDTETDLHCWCQKPGFTLIVMGRYNNRNLFALAKWIKLNYPFSLNFYYLPYSKRNHHVFEVFEIKENGKKAIIVRPDMHIGYLNDVVDTELIGGYLQEMTGK